MTGVTAAVAMPRDPGDWVEDMSWHRRMFAQSKFRWAPEDPMALALTWARGRLVYDSPAHLRLLDERRMDLADFASQIDDAMVAPLTEARRRCKRKDWLAGLELIGLTPTDVEILEFHAHRRPIPNREVRRALRGIPLPNPFSQVWELRQMRSMYTAAENLLEDTLCDLVVELAPTQGWDYLGQLMSYPISGSSLRWLVDEQRRDRGEPGDPRRVPAQHF